VEFGPKPPGTYRIVMVGSSIAMGFGVEREKTFAALLPGELSSRTGRRVELFNESFAGGSGVAVHLNEALAFKPDLILWILAPWDIEQGVGTVQHVQKSDRNVPFARRVWGRIKPLFARTSFTGAIEETFDLTRTSLLLRHFLFESQSQYVKYYLMSDDKEAGFLKIKPSEEWEERLRQFSVVVTENEAKAHTAGVPLVAAFVPNRALAAMISMGEWPIGYNPYKLADEMGSIITSRGGIYVDTLPGFGRIPNPEQHYFPVDGHPDAGGQAILANLLAKELTSGAVPALRVAAQSQLAQAQER
jgi:hypothetical protein